MLCITFTLIFLLLTILTKNTFWAAKVRVNAKPSAEAEGQHQRDGYLFYYVHTSLENGFVVGT